MEKQNIQQMEILQAIEEAIGRIETYRKRNKVKFDAEKCKLSPLLEKLRETANASNSLHNPDNSINLRETFLEPLTDNPEFLTAVLSDVVDNFDILFAEIPHIHSKDDRNTECIFLYFKAKDNANLIKAILINVFHKELYGIFEIKTEHIEDIKHMDFRKVLVKVTKTHLFKYSNMVDVRGYVISSEKVSKIMQYGIVDYYTRYYRGNKDVYNNRI